MEEIQAAATQYILRVQRTLLDWPEGVALSQHVASRQNHRQPIRVRFILFLSPCNLRGFSCCTQRRKIIIHKNKIEIAPILFQHSVTRPNVPVYHNDFSQPQSYLHLWSILDETFNFDCESNTFMT